jgi:hypothetical protein
VKIVFEKSMPVDFTPGEERGGGQQEQRRVWHMPLTCMLKIKDILVSVSARKILKGDKIRVPNFLLEIKNT